MAYWGHISAIFIIHTLDTDSNVILGVENYAPKDHSSLCGNGPLCKHYVMFRSQQSLVPRNWGPKHFQWTLLLD